MTLLPSDRWLLLALFGLVLSGCDDSIPNTEMISIEANASLGTGAFLIDRLENTVEEVGAGSSASEVARVREGASPRHSISYTRAKALCEAVAKRICTRKEWQAACRGTQNFKYGVQEGFESPDPLSQVCVSGRGDELGNLLEGSETEFPRPTGEKNTCTSGGVGDLIGNLSEWVLLEDSGGEVTGSAFTGGVPAGGHHLVRDEQNHCDFIWFRDADGDGVVDSVFPEDTESSQVGFRCCRDPA